ncbi:MAG: hypothetical protein MZV64_60250 [Ignavibacteriales bacterium]|nr:hypothetical protein [Ignavibacteriales bacterium]
MDIASRHRGRRSACIWKRSALNEELQKRAAELQTVARSEYHRIHRAGPGRIAAIGRGPDQGTFRSVPCAYLPAGRTWDTLFLAAGAGEIGRKWHGRLRTSRSTHRKVHSWHAPPANAPPSSPTMFRVRTRFSPESLPARYAL